MKADLTRNTFNQFNHFSRVIEQQGRPQLDADWNEQAAILLRYLRVLATDLIGPQGGPSGPNYGFAISPITTPATPNDFRIGLGRYYVDGILCEADSQPVGITVKSATQIVVDQWTLDGAPFKNGQLVEVFDDAQGPNANPAFSPTLVQISNADVATLTLTLQNAPAFGTLVAPKVRKVITYLTQPDYPVPGPATLAAGSTYIVYLDVWERLITYVENDSIREVALGGPDTAARSKVVWQVKTAAGTVALTSAGDHTACDNFTPTDKALFGELFDLNHGLLRARAKQTSVTDPCIIPPSANYRGPENQLYRVEIHRSGAAWDGTDNGKSTAATFKWSRENGSVVFPIVSLSTGNGVTTLVLETLGRDDRLGLAEGDWVEAQDDIYVEQNRAGNMQQVQQIDRPNLTVTLSGVPGSDVGTKASANPLLRRWDYQAGDPADGGLVLASDNAALVQEMAKGWLNLEDGVQIQFPPPDSGQSAHLYQTAQYWMIPARTATQDVEWPTETRKDASGNTVIVPLAKVPDGIQHDYAPLAVIAVSAAGVVSLSGDCRKQFAPLAHT
jgi:hypothetical protein